MTFQHNTLYSITPSPDGSVDTRFKDGTKPGSGQPLIQLNLATFATLMAAFANMVSGDVVTVNLAPAYSGAGAANATLAILTLSGDDAAANGWVISGTRLTATA